MSRTLNYTLPRVRHESLCEPETQRLQRAADTFTQQLALEKRRNASLNDRITHTTTQVSVKKETLKQAMADNKEQRRLMTRIEQLENQLLKERQVLNQHLLRNELLREQVDVYRREKRAFFSTFRDFEGEEKQYSRSSAMAYKSFLQVHDVDKHTAHELVRLKLKGEAALNTYESQAYALQTAIETERKEETVKVHQLASAMMADLTSSKDFVDMRSLLQALYDRWSSLAKTRKAEIETHTKEIEVLWDAFAQIKEATGIGEIEEVVTAFIKSEEQNYALYKQIAALTSEADSLEEQVKELDQTLVGLQSAAEVRERQKIEKNWDHDQRLILLRSEGSKCAKQSLYITDNIVSVGPLVEELLTPGRELGLADTSLALEEFNEHSAEEVLGTVEDSMTAVLTYLRLQSGQGLLPTTDLPDKDFTWRPPGISAQVEQIYQDFAEEDDHALSEKEFHRRMIQRVRRNVMRGRE